ncbi:hypothetical protein RJ641_034299 [Dillenia turbinata]|uniref:Uncharacterized protein n=1 Tax=Dillenia turbinata TaxID=194707 RepID=A0AAN8VM37_9MAGN
MLTKMLLSHKIEAHENQTLSQILSCAKLSSFSMDPYDEQRLRDEVIYLHSLWHRGSSSSSNRKPRFTSTLKPANSQSSKKSSKKGKNKNPPVSDVQWIAPELLSRKVETTGWPKPKTHLANSVSADQLAKFASTQLHLKVLKACEGFFRATVDSDDDGDEYEDQDEDDLMKDEEDCDDGSDFFMTLFNDDDEIRGHYVKNCENGEFYCLVCSAIGKKLGKKFKNCVALVQHSISISKTKKRRAHRAYSRVICQVLGWDINHLPNIQSSLADSLNQSQGNADGISGGRKVISNASNKNENTGNASHNSAVPGQNIDACWKEGESSRHNSVNGKPVICNASQPSGDDTGWPSATPLVVPASTLVSAEESAKLSASLLHLKGLKACEEFFHNNEDDEDSEDDLENDNLMEEDDNKDRFNFFLKMLNDDEGLRSYYEQNNSGEFYCLVCSGMVKKLVKKFNHCIALVQHSSSISKTKRRRDHRAYAQAICHIFGWDVNSLPVSVCLAGEATSQSQGLTNTKDDGDKESFPASNGQEIDVNRDTDPIIEKDTLVLISPFPLNERNQ